MQPHIAVTWRERWKTTILPSFFITKLTLACVANILLGALSRSSLRRRGISLAAVAALGGGLYHWICASRLIGVNKCLLLRSQLKLIRKIKLYLLAAEATSALCWSSAVNVEDGSFVQKQQAPLIMIFDERLKSRPKASNKQQRGSDIEDLLWN